MLSFVLFFLWKIICLKHCTGRKKPATKLTKHLLLSSLPCLKIPNINNSAEGLMILRLIFYRLDWIIYYMLEFIPAVLLRLAAEWGEKHTDLEGKFSMAGVAVWQLPPSQLGQGTAEGKNYQQTKGLGNSQQWQGVRKVQPKQRDWKDFHWVVFLSHFSGIQLRVWISNTVILQMHNSGHKERTALLGGNNLVFLVWKIRTNLSLRLWNIISSMSFVPWVQN